MIGTLFAPSTEQLEPSQLETLGASKDAEWEIIDNVIIPDSSLVPQLEPSEEDLKFKADAANSGRLL